MGVQFLSGWCKNAIKGFDVLEVFRQNKDYYLKKKATRNKKLFLAKSFIERKLLV
ncbi:hypothetical protein KVD69_05940 [Helicobacter pylori]|nr:hypothetical protein KVD69_05940 [Helicobacter pylori]